jgi:hypothetical protein
MKAELTHIEFNELEKRVNRITDEISVVAEGIGLASVDELEVEFEFTYDDTSDNFSFSGGAINEDLPLSVLSAVDELIDTLTLEEALEYFDGDF